MASSFKDLPAKQWVEIGSDDCSLQHKTEWLVHLIQDDTEPTSPITDDDLKRSKVLGRHEIATVVDIDGKLWAYCHCEVSISIDIAGG